MGKNTPVHEVKFGRVRAAVWANEGETGTWYSVTFSKLYKDREGKWQDSGSFSREDLPLLVKAADQAHDWLYRTGKNDEEVPGEV
jgi:hypothetical protein